MTEEKDPVVLKRKLYDRLLEWKNKSRGTSALMIDGARRVGKSYLCRQFAENEYESYIMIDFGNAPVEILDLFAYDSSNLDLFFAKLSAFYSTLLHKRSSVIIFDEVQQYPRARQLRKYLVVMEDTTILKQVLLFASERMFRTLSYRLRRSMLRCFLWILRSSCGRWATLPRCRLSEAASITGLLWGRPFIAR